MPIPAAAGCLSAAALYIQPQGAASSLHPCASPRGRRAVRSTADYIARENVPSGDEHLNQEARHGTTELLIFELSGVRYAVKLGCVREVNRAVLITPLPDAPPVIEGVIDVRGELAPVYDLRLRFGLAPRPLHPDDRLIVAWTGERLVALRCEHTDWIENVPEDAIEAPPSARGERIAGVAKLPDGVVLIHDLSAFLEEAESQQLAGALDAYASGESR